MNDAPWRDAQVAMTGAGVDVLVVASGAAATRLGGHRRIGVRQADAPIPSFVLGAHDVAPHICTPDPEGALHLPADHVHPHGFNPLTFASRWRDWFPDARRVALDVDDDSARAIVRAAFGGDVEIVSGDVVGIDRWTPTVSVPRDRHTRDAVDALHAGYRRTEAALFALVEELGPGVTEREASARFAAAGARNGLPDSHIEHIVVVAARTRADAPWLRVDFERAWPWRQLVGNRTLAAGDTVFVDAGFLHDGWVTDLGCTLLIGRDASPDEAALAAEWRTVANRVTAAARAGANAADLRAAALDGWSDGNGGGHPPWPDGLYVAHGIGDGTVVPPFAGTDLGVDVERTMTLEAGDVLMVEPYVWRDGVGGFRAERCICVTDDAAEVWSSPQLEAHLRVG